VLLALAGKERRLSLDSLFMLLRCVATILRKTHGYGGPRQYNYFHYSWRGALVVSFRITSTVSYPAIPLIRVPYENEPCGFLCGFLVGLLFRHLLTASGREKPTTVFPQNGLVL